MTADKPELIAFSQHTLGGVQSFYYNLLSNDSKGHFEKKWILSEAKGHKSIFPPQPYNIGEVIVKYDPANGTADTVAIFETYISDKPGVVLANHLPELNALLHRPKKNKTVIFLVHDSFYLPLAREFINAIDVLVTHNYAFYQDLQAMFPELVKYIFFLPYGINLSKKTRSPNLNRVLKIAFVGRLCVEKGIFDIIDIDTYLRRGKVNVEWLIIGDGPEKESFLTKIRGKKNFVHKTLGSTEEIFEELTHCDAYILPSILDGTPVALLEAMSVGLVPLLYKFNNGIKKVVTEDIGYIVELGNIKGIGAVIKALDVDRQLLETKSINASKSARMNYDVATRAADYYALFDRFEELKREKSYKLVDMTPFAEVAVEQPTTRKAIAFVKHKLRSYKRKLGL